MFGRANSLSLNTGAANSLFNQQQQQQQGQQQPAASGGGSGLFGSNTQQPATSGGSGLFGSSAQQPAASGGGGLFGSSTQQPATSSGGGLFGSSTQQPATSGGTGLFGSSTQQPAASGGGGGGGLFGSSTQQPATSGGGGLFSGGAQQGNSTSSSLFGGNTQQQNSGTTGSSLFGGNQQQQNAGTSGLFGGSNQTNATTNTSSLFGPTSQPQQNANTGSSLFGGVSQQQPANSGSSLFGSKPTQALGGGSLFGQPQQQQQQPPSLFAATQAASLNRSAPFAGRLSMGQGAVAQGQATVPAVKIDLDGLRPTTRFEDLTDQMKAELESLDRMIQLQEGYHTQIQAIMPNHGQGITSLGPDVEFIKDKVDAVDSALSSDAHGVKAQLQVAAKDLQDVERCQRNITNLNLPQNYQFAKLGYATGTGLYGDQGQQSGRSQSSQPGHPSHSGSGNQNASSSDFDADLVGNYFVPLAADMQKFIDKYASNLVEIEQHMQVIESSAISQAQHLVHRKAGNADTTGSANATVRELADTLRGFEASILGVAGVVGECREGINQLVLGRVSGRL